METIFVSSMFQDMMRSYEKFEFCPCETTDTIQSPYALRSDVGRRTAARMDNVREVRMAQSPHRIDVQNPMDAAFRMIGQMNEKEII